MLQRSRPARRVLAPRPQTLSAVGPGRHRPDGAAFQFSFRVGDRIGEDLTVIGHLSAGRSAEIYQVWSSLHICALTCKIMRRGISPRGWERRSFRKEVSLLRRLSHPHIVRPFGRGTFDDREYLLEEFLHGPSLVEWLDRAPDGRLDVAEAIKSVLHVCGALDHLHGQGYVHCDVKPANIILRGGIPVLVDFGSAWRFGADRKPGQRSGTDPYMSPEQVARQPLGPPTDVYSMGAVLYEMLTGRWPFEDALLDGAGSSRLLVRYPQARLEPPPSPARFRELPPGVEAVVMKCLEPEVSARFSSVRPLVEALGLLLEDEASLWPEGLRESVRIA